MWKEKFLTLLLANRSLWLPLGLASAGILLILIGIIATVVGENREKGVIIEESASSDRSGEIAIVVDVGGAVEKPGVYKLTSNARIQEALIAAGGLSQQADREYVSKNINLAAKVSDGGKIYIPRKGESITSTTPLRQGFAGQGGEVAGVVTGLININSATASELDKLPGVGPVTAAKIIDNRPYSSIEDLLTKKIVGKKVFADIKERISTY